MSTSNNPFLTHTESNAVPGPEPPTGTLIPSLVEPDTEALNEELPPAYTLAPDPEQGEASIEFGPRRPFQQAPQPVQPPQYLTPTSESDSSGRFIGHGRSKSHSRTNREQQSFLQQLIGWRDSGPSRRPSSADDSTRSDVFTYPGNRRPDQSQAASTVSRFLPPPLPPRDAATSSLSLPSSTTNNTGISEFARDFYAAGAATDLVTADSGSSIESSSSSRYAPPPGQPPPPVPPKPSQGVPDDGRPTKTAVPGHPLLHNDQILVYPAGHVCDKCNNTGYKHNDPTNPCRKCWSKYAKPYAGAVLYTSWASNSSTSSSTNGSASTFQRPLPGPARPIPSELPRNSRTNVRSGTVQRPRSRSHGHSASMSSRSSGPPVPARPRIAIADPSFNTPPPGSLVVAPGDPRLGGRRCWKCDGAGVVPFFIFEQTSCETCGGTGRVYV